MDGMTVKSMNRRFLDSTNDLRRPCSAHSPCAVIVLCPVAAGQVRVGDCGTGVGSVDKLAAARVDTYVRQSGGICIRKEYDIAGLKIVLADLTALLPLVGRGSVGGVAALLQHVVDKAGAVKAGWTGTSIDIWNAEIFLRLCQNAAA